MDLGRTTVVVQDGYRVLLIVAIPMLLSILVGLALRSGHPTPSRGAKVLAWTLAIAVLGGGIIGFLTFFTPGVILPIGVLLVVACGRTAPLRRGAD